VSDAAVEQEIADEIEPDEQLEPDAEPEPDVDDPDDEPDEDDDPEATAILAQALSDKEIEKRQRSLEKESERHEKRIREILGSDAEGLVKCEACPETISGYHYGPDDYPPGSGERALYEMLQAGDASMMRHPEWLETCEECNGFGQVLTGARTEMTKQLTCPVCKGAGYVDTRDGNAPTPMRVLVVPDRGVGDDEEPATPAKPEEPEKDMWGRPPGHPRYWQPPFALTPEARAEDLADGFTVDM
jgi:rubrerythrin